MNDWHTIADHISHSTASPFTVARSSAVGGGSINRADVLSGEDGRRFFVKRNQAALLSMFEAEADGLQAMAETNSVRVPRPTCHGSDGTQAWLVMEYIPSGAASPGSAAALGRQLAAMHRSTRPQFGWHRDNTIGSTPQHNAERPDWVSFWRDRRLGFQLRLAADNGHRGALQRDGERLLGRVDQLLSGHQPVPSLLHGDLWSGNAGTDADGRPLIFDPACYYGDREADIAMTELFGGFAPAFHAAYREAWPLDDGYPLRRTLYNLYHILNHANLFGGGYSAQAMGMIQSLLAQLR